MYSKWTPKSNSQYIKIDITLAKYGLCNLLAFDLKSSFPQGNGGSNPSLSVFLRLIYFSTVTFVGLGFENVNI